MTEYNIDSEAFIAAATGGMEWDVYDKDSTLTVKKVALAQTWSAFPAVHADTLQSAAIPAADLVGGGLVILLNTGTTPGTLTTDTATAILAALPAAARVVGTQWLVLIRNNSGSANTATVAAGTGVTLTGTMTIAQNASRLFLAAVTATGTPAITLTSIGLMTGA